MARNPVSHVPRSREWHRVTTGWLRARGVATPTYRKDAWEVDWSRRDGKRVMARNPLSKMPASRGWHWVDMTSVLRAGVRWKPKTEKTGRHKTRQGYVQLTRRAMTADEVALADEFGLWRGSRKMCVAEHRLVACKKYGGLNRATVVRHINGVKDDNRPENLVVGTSAENTADHNTARVMCMYWHNEADRLARKCEMLQAVYEALLAKE